MPKTNEVDRILKNTRCNYCDGCLNYGNNNCEKIIAQAKKELDKVYKKRYWKKFQRDIKRALNKASSYGQEGK